MNRKTARLRKASIAFSILLGLALALLVWGGLAQNGAAASAKATIFSYLAMIANGASPGGEYQYVLIGWNDLGMHCYNHDFQDLAVLPPYNTLNAQVIRRSDPPEIVKYGVTISYSFPANTYSVGKTNFWEYTNQLFKVTLPPNVGLKGKGLSGTMDLKDDYFTAEGIPLMEYDDNNLTQRQPYQLAELVAKDLNGKVLATNTVVAPVSTEMHCDNCHQDGGVEGVSTGRVETNILTLHDMHNQEDYPAGNKTPLMNRRPVLCAECHSSNALGAPGVTGIPSLSNAIHSHHVEVIPNTLEGCYNCHPGPTTRCLRDVMSQDEGMVCEDCHGTMAKVAQNPNPWLNEPRCDTCHTDIPLDQPLYRMSHGHGGLFCEACHDSTHAIATSRESRDAIKFVNLQGHAGTLSKCTVCHMTQPAGEGPHHN